MNNKSSPFQGLKRAVVGAIGRERANKIAEPYHDWRARRATQKYLAALPASDLCVHLGCGYRPLKGWINVDQARGPDVQVVWDLRRGLPFRDQSCAMIFSEHLIEHVPKEAANSLLAECCRTMSKGGVLRLSTPDAGRYLRSYAGDQEFLRHPSFGADAEAPMDRVNQMMREYGQHLWVYDAETLTLALKRAGFSRIVEQEFAQSLVPKMQGIDSEARAFESFYLEAVK